MKRLVAALFLWLLAVLQFAFGDGDNGHIYLAASILALLVPDDRK